MPRGNAIRPEEILSDLLGHDPNLRLERCWGEASIFYNPGLKALLGLVRVSV